MIHLGNTQAVDYDDAMETADFEILDAVIGVVNRYGIKRTTMDELARHAGVSRQTLYDRYGGKDAVMAAAINLIAQRLKDALQAAFAEEPTLAGKIDAYYRIAVFPIFEMMQAMPDAADFERGLGPRSTEASAQGSVLKQALLAEAFAPHLHAERHDPKAVAVFFEQSLARAKMSGVTRAELEEYVAVLKAAILAMAKEK